MNPLELGIISLTDLQLDPVTGVRADPAVRTREILGYAVLAETVGLDVFGLGEHHTPDFAVSSPAVTLAAAAALTTSITLTTGSTVLNLHDPVRVYEDFASLDLVSNGRAEIVAGRSAFAEPFELFGIPMDEYDARFAENLELLLKLRAQHTTGGTAWSGHFRVPLTGQAVPPVLSRELPVWVAVGGSPESAIRAGSLGLPMVLGYIGGPLEHLRQLAGLYRQAGDAAGHTGRLKLGISTHFLAAPDHAAAMRAYPYYHEYLRPKPPQFRGWDVSTAQFEAGMTPGGHLLIGTPEQLIEKILTIHHSIGIDRFYGQIDWGGLPRGVVEESITVFGEQIAPILRQTLAGL